jgi:molybdenum cofactor biosynthesis enzyme MoaA
MTLPYNSETFCVNPWITLHATVHGGYNPCCVFDGKINSKEITQYVNSAELTKIKQDLLAGIRVPGCDKCWKNEDRQHVSKRQRDNQTYGRVFQALYKDLSTPKDQFIEYYIRLGNHCNLRCTSCNDKASSGWISENKKFNISTGEVELLSDTHEIWQHMRDHAGTIGAIEFIGGEPFMMSTEAQVDLFKYLINHNHARHIRIKYNTNGTRMPTEQLDYWKHFKAIEINVSVDGVGRRFEYLRYPGQWSQVNDNINFYKNLQLTTIPKLELTVVHTLSVLNIGYVNDILDYCQDQKLNLFLNLVNDPKVLNLFAAVPEIKSWITEQIKTVEHPVISGIVKNLDQGTNCVTAQEILNFLNPLDQRRNTNAEEVFPELINYLEQCSE